MSLPVALQLFSVRDRMEIDKKATLKAVSDMGYNGIEVCGGSYGMDPEEFREYCEGLGLRIISAHVGTDAIIRETEETLKLYKTLGASYVAICAFWGDYQYKKPAYDSMIKELDEAGKYFKENGIQILYHNHEWEFRKHDGQYELDLIINDTKDNNLLPEIDVCWATLGHGDAPDFMTRYKDRCPVVHLKDFHCKGEYLWEKNDFKRKDDFRFRPVGYGRVDMAGVLSTAEEIGAKWLVVEQDMPAFGLGELDNAKISRDWLKTIGY